MHVFLLQDKVMLGTDYPFPLGELEPGSLIQSMDEFDDKLKVKIFSPLFQELCYFSCDPTLLRLYNDSVTKSY